MSATLLLRDVHEGIAPPWWPPAPGWWMLAVAVAVVALVVGLRARARRRRQAAIGGLFDQALAAAPTPGQQVAAMSELLRRAARRRRADADTLDGEAWLAFLDEGLPQPVFLTSPAGGLLLEGGFRDDVTEAEAVALRPLARTRYLRWMLGR